MKNVTCLRPLGIAVLLAALGMQARSAETNQPPAGALPPTEFHLTSQPQEPGRNQSRPLPPSVNQSNTARLLQRRAALLKDLRNRPNTNGSVMVGPSNRTAQLQLRIDELNRKKTEGTITSGEQQQLEQLEIMATRLAGTNSAPTSATAPPRVPGAEQKNQAP